MRMLQYKTLWMACIGMVVVSTASAGIADHVVRTKAGGVDLIIYPMGVKDVVTIGGTLPAGDSYAAGGNIAAASLTGMLLDKGTTKHDKFAIARQLDDVGAQLGFEVGQQTVSIAGKSLKKDVPMVIRLLAEELRTPAFSAEECAKAKTQFEGQMRPVLENTNYRAKDAFSRVVYGEGNPNRLIELPKWIAAAQSLRLEEIKAFHKKYYGPAHLTLVFVGDVDAKVIRSEVAKAFGSWSGGVDVEREAKAGESAARREEKVSLKDKTSVSVVLGQATGLRYQDADTLALRVGTAILGSGFTGRLMHTVRDKEGLTYGIGASVADDTFVSGSWLISATFAPALLDKGIASTRRELDKWWQGGVTADELAARKTNMIGQYQVGLATTEGMAGAILQTVSRGKPLSWLDELPKAIDALTVDRVNAVISKHLDPAKMVLVEAGTLPAP